MEFSGISLPHGLFLAPMAGFTDHAMRAVCTAHGAEYTVTEMVSAKAVVYGDRKTADLARIYEEEVPCALQLFGSEEEILARAAETMSRGVPGGMLPAAIDLNMGCPVPKVFGNGEGSALMRDPEKIYRILLAVRGATDLPVTVKLRAGIDPAHKNAVECALAAEAGGAALVAVHGRTRSEFYGGHADRAVIAAVKRAVKIPVIANGDITTAGDALAVFRETGADGVMIGRGAVGNPFLFSEIRAALDGVSYTPPTAEERAATALSELALAVAEKGESVAVREARKRLSQYLRGFRGAAALRARIHLAETAEEIGAAFDLALAEQEREGEETE